MGKSLVIKGGNFAANGIPDLSVYTDISSNVVESDIHRQYMHYPQSSPVQYNDCFVYNASAYANNHICSIDVSAYVGKKIRLYASDNYEASHYTGGAYFKCFASAVDVALPWTGTTNKQNALTAVERINGHGSPNTLSVWDLVVPAGAVYLIFNNNDTVILHPKVYVEAD